jgi:hypothetical protein
MLLHEHEHKYKYAGYIEGAWELLHEDVGFLGPELLADKELADVDGNETHLMHEMDEPVSHEMEMQKKK